MRARLHCKRGQTQRRKTNVPRGKAKLHKRQPPPEERDEAQGQERDVPRTNLKVKLYREGQTQGMTRNGPGSCSDSYRWQNTDIVWRVFPKPISSASIPLAPNFLR